MGFLGVLTGKVCASITSHPAAALSRKPWSQVLDPVHPDNSGSHAETDAEVGRMVASTPPRRAAGLVVRGIC